MRWANKISKWAITKLIGSKNRDNYYSLGFLIENKKTITIRDCDSDVDSDI